MSHRALALLLFAALAFVWFGTLSERKLVRPDEGRYAEISREMVATGDWTTPRLNGYKYFEKPALQYWATAVAYELFGIREWTARLWTALTGFLGILLVFYAGNRAFPLVRQPPPATGSTDSGVSGAGLSGSGLQVGPIAAAVLTGSLWWALIGHINTLDMGVSFFMTLTVFGVMLAQLDDASPKERMVWMHAAWAAAALALLSKGLIGIVLPGGAFVAYLLLQRDWRRLQRLHFTTGLLLFLAISAPWFFAVSAANKEFFHFFFIQEHFERFLTKAHGRYQPAWYFIPILLIGFSPWILSLGPGLVRSWREGSAATFRPARFLLIWAVLVFAFFSVSSSKLPSYILPIFPALALLVGVWAVRAGRALLLGQSLLYAVVGLAGAIAASPLVMKAANPELPAELLAAYLPWIIGACLTLALLASASAWHAWNRQVLPAFVFLSAGGLFCSLGLLLGHETLAPAYSAYHVAEKIRPALKPGVPFYTVNMFDHTIPYYLGRTVTMVAYKDELAQPIGWEPGGYLSDLPAFAQAWRDAPDAWAAFSAGDFERMQRELQIPMQVVVQDPRRIVVRKPMQGQAGQ